VQGLKIRSFSTKEKSLIKEKDSKWLQVTRKNFTNDSFSLFSSKKTNTTDLLVKIDEVLFILDSHTGAIGRGYLNNTNLLNYPIIKEILPYFLKKEEHKKTLAYTEGSKAKDIYHWIYNLIIINLYQICYERLTNFDPRLAESDLKANLKIKELSLLKRLDPTLRQALLKRGISIIQNIYTGFDTEYKNKEARRNEMLSCQLAITTKTYLKVPKKRLYATSKMDVAADVVRTYQKSEDLFNYTKLEKYLQHFIDLIRGYKFGEYDKLMNKLVKTLNDLPVFKSRESDDFITFTLPRSDIQPAIFYGNSYSIKNMVGYSNKIGGVYLDKTYSDLISYIKNIFTLESYDEILKHESFQQLQKYFSLSPVSSESPELEQPVVTKTELTLVNNVLPLFSSDLQQFQVEEHEEKGGKKLSRINMYDLFPKDEKDQPQKVSVTRVKNLYLIAHLTHADLSLMSDFELIKDFLSIINGSFVTLGKPFVYENTNIYIRDTMLLAPGGSKSLASIGKLYGEDFNKIQISKEEIENMDKFLLSNKAKYEEYAVRDALIALIHASWMEDFNFSLGGVGVPLSLSSIGRKYVKDIWKKESYPGYQINHKYLLGDTSATITPIGLNMLKNVGLVLPYFTANYKGGRNESFMYGLDTETLWYDYDLVSAYTTVLSRAGHPDYANLKSIKEEDLKSLSKDEILYSYMIIKASFTFDDSVKFPSIPCYVDDTCTVYPLQGKCLLTGAEYLLATSQNCKFTIEEIYKIPFSTFTKKVVKVKGKKSETGDIIRPFAEILKQIQAKRREYPKGTINNLMYKEIGNSIYGSTVRGMGNKRRFDIKTGTSVRVEGDDLTNPLIAS
jgi:hypothetical protein